MTAIAAIIANRVGRLSFVVITTIPFSKGTTLHSPVENCFS
jgi:hypothetical protein